MTEPNKFLKAALRVAELVYEKERMENPHSHNSHAAQTALMEAAKILDLDGYMTFGVEGVCIPDNAYTERGSRSMSYLNAGDTYALTLIWDQAKEEFEITTYGDWYEQAEDAYEEDNDTIRCAYCGHFTPRDEDVEWHDIVCESCGHCVDGTDAPPKGGDDDEETETGEECHSESDRGPSSYDGAE
jgi:hypothetical protein